MTTFAVSAWRKAASDSEHAIQFFEVFEDIAEARRKGETLTNDPRMQDIAVWELVGRPILKTHIEWEKPNGETGT